jgi:hypothetical protein
VGNNGILSSGEQCEFEQRRADGNKANENKWKQRAQRNRIPIDNGDSKYCNSTMTQYKGKLYDEIHSQCNFERKLSPVCKNSPDLHSTERFHCLVNLYASKYLEFVF